MLELPSLPRRFDLVPHKAEQAAPECVERVAVASQVDDPFNDVLLEDALARDSGVQRVQETREHTVLAGWHQLAEDERESPDFPH